MSLGDITDREAVLRAMSEYRELGRSEFLERYGFSGSRHYVISLDGRRYDAKAIVGAAHGYQFPDLGPLTAAQFSGGVQGANSVLERLGFPVVDLRSWSVEDERTWREAVWAEIRRAGPTLEPTLVRELGAYGGAQGVWVDKERTRALEPVGVAVGVLHTGSLR